MLTPMTVSPGMKETSERKEHLENAKLPKTIIISKLERRGIKCRNNIVIITIIIILN